MNIKGIKLNKKLIKLLYESKDKLNKESYRGLNVFNKFSWSGFSKDEFVNLLKLFVSLDENGLFDEVLKEQTFIFNYSTDITEMDIATVLMYKGNPCFIDIESKNGNDESLEGKIEQQLLKRKEEHLPQFLKGKPFITIGFINGRFVKAYFYDGKNNIEIRFFEYIKDIFKNMTSYADVTEFMTQICNISSITQIGLKIENNTYNFYSDTNKIYELLTKKMEGHDAAIIYGNAGTGKSVLALKLFYEIDNTKLLLLNSKLYYTLEFDKKYYSKNKATFNTESFLEMINSNTISIIDECQRLPIETMVKIIKKSKFTFLFGDNRQAFCKNSSLLSYKELESTLKKQYEIDSYSKHISKARRYSDEVDKALGILTSNSDITSDIKIPSDYKIKLFYDENEFLAAYDNEEAIKKIYTPIHCGADLIKIADKTFYKAKYNDDDFSILPSTSSYYGITYHALSFDIDHCFVYLKNIKIITKDKKRFMFYKDTYEDFDEVNYFLNELNILFTRGKKSLNIYVDDIETYLYLNYRLSKIR